MARWHWILLDQYPRNTYRGTARLFVTDPLALRLAERAIAAGHDLAVDPALRRFFYMPFEHAEPLEAQNRAATLMKPLGADVVRWADGPCRPSRRFGTLAVSPTERARGASSPYN